MLKHMIIFAAVVGLLFALAPAEQAKAAGVIYIDFGYPSDDDYTVGANTANVRNANGTTSDLDTVDGTATAIDLTAADFTAFGDAGDGVMPNSGTDGYDLFEGYIDAAGNSHVTSTSDPAILTFSGLDPSLRYDIALLGNRAPVGAGSHETATLTGVEEGFSNISSDGTAISTATLTDDTTDFDTRGNMAGLVARWTDINPGADGEFSVNLQAQQEQFVAYYLNGVRLEVIPEPGTMVMLLTGLAGLFLMVWRRR